MQTMRAVVLDAPHNLSVREVPKPTITEPTDVLLRVDLTAICGTDLHPYEGRMDVEAGIILGHEFLGTVVEVGSAVGQFEEGDRAVASFHVSCGHCRWCRTGDQARCIGGRIFGLGMALGDLAGGQAEYVVVPNADMTMRKIPDDGSASDEDLLFVGDILATGYEAVRKAFVPGDTVAIVGAGPVGLSAVMAADVLGAGQIIVVDRIEARLKEAERLGAIAINIDENDPADAVLDLTEWRGADVVVDAVGHESALRSACAMVRSGGAITIPGVYNEESIELPFGDLWLRGVRIYPGVANVTNQMDELIALIKAGRLNPGSIISHRMGLSEAPLAYQMFEAREATKIVLDPRS